MIELLKYMEHSTDEVSEVCKSERIQKMHRRICQIKASEKTEVKYMQSWEEKILIKQEGIAEGRLEGKLEEKQELMRKLSNKFSIEQIAEMLEIDISEVENIIKETDKNAEIIYKSKEDALNDMKQHFADRQNLLEGYEENNIFPAYYEVNSNKKAIEEIDKK